MKKMTQEDATILMTIRKRIAAKKTHELKSKRDVLKKLPLEERLAERSIVRMIKSR